MYAHPINAKAVSSGLEIGYTPEHVFAANDYLYPFTSQLTVGMTGLNAPKTTTDGYGDWTVTALWEDGLRSMTATLGHGLPYVFFRLTGGTARITTQNTPSIWYNQDGVLGISVDGRHYGIFGPAGSIWAGTTSLTSELAGKDYLSVALLPDASPASLELFRKHAYAFVTNSRVDWDYNESEANVTSTFTYDTELLEQGGGNVNATMTALYRHQWLYSDDPLTGDVYKSPNGEMKLLEGSVFSTEHPFSGVLPALPDRGDYNRSDLLAFVQAAAGESLAIQGTYDDGKALARFANLVHIAEQIGATEERDYFLAAIKQRLEDWFTAGGAQTYVYLDDWNVMTGYPSGFGADNQINDHHFHASYAIMSAATVAQYDPEWAAQEKWGAMVNLLISDANNWDRSDERFPFLRSHDAYAGHSWAAGHGDFGDGNNQESSSESMNFASAVLLWGEATDQDAIRDVGAFLYATEAAAIDQYWFDVENRVFPESYPHKAIAMVWGGKGVHSTWFGAEPEYIHGINILPITGGSLYLGRHPDYVLENYGEIVSERNGQPIVWKDVLWEYLALSDPAQALAYYFADQSYEPFDGESRAHTLHWLFNLKKMGHVDTSVSANIPTYAVFRTASGEKTYVAYNAGLAERLVTFSDGYELTVDPKTLASASTANENTDAPVALLLADKTSGKAPLTVRFEGSKSFDRNEEDLTFDWTFGGVGMSVAADTVFTFPIPGEYKVRLIVTNASGFTSVDSVRINVLGNGTPFLGNPAKVPVRIEAEHYDNGGEGRAYHDTEANNIGLAFRPAEGVDIEPSNDQGFDVYWIVAGEWLEYTFEVVEPGVYTFTPFVASVPGMGGFRMLIDNIDVSGFRRVSGTGGWQFWKPVPVQNVELEPGVHIMRLEFESELDKTGWLFSLNYIDVAKSTSISTERDDEMPLEYRLEQAYPNPFNPSTLITYSLPVSGPVQLEIYDVTGRRIRQLVNAVKPAGTHSVTFDATNLPGGMYIYRLVASQYIEARKVLLVK